MTRSASPSASTSATLDECARGHLWRGLLHIMAVGGIDQGEHETLLSWDERAARQRYQPLPASLPNIMPTVEDEHDANPDRRSRRPDSVGQPCGDARRTRV